MAMAGGTLKEPSARVGRLWHIKSLGLVYGRMFDWTWTAGSRVFQH